MSLAAFSIRRRVTVMMAAVTGLLFGAIALNELPVNLLPELSYPTLTVRTEWPGAAPSEVETAISEPVEEALGVVRGVRKLVSSSRTGQSDVRLQFAWGTDMEQATLQVRERLEMLTLPLDAKKPLLLRFDPSSDPVMRLALAWEGTAAGQGENAQKRLRRYAEDRLRKRLEPLDGVAAVKVSGGLQDEVHVWLDLPTLARLGLRPETVVQRLEEENVNLSAGQLEQGQQRYLLRSLNQFRSVEEMAGLILREVDGVPVRLRDVAEVRMGHARPQAIIRLDGRPAVELALYKEGDFNLVRMADGVHRALGRLRKNLPEGMQLAVVADQSEFVRQSIREVANAAWLGGLLAVLVVYWFLGQARPTFIIGLAIPLSLVTAFFFLYRWEISLNMMSLGGMALAAGLLVDNAIVVLENIARQRELGHSQREAASRGAEEVSGAVVASTLTTVAVFVPLVFVEGIAGQLFRDQSLTVAIALLVSLAVALTLIPMLAAGKPAVNGPEPEPAPEDGLPTTARLTRLRRALLITLPRRLAAGLRSLWRLAGRGLGGVMRPGVWLMQRFMRVAEALYGRLLPWALRHRAAVLLSAGLLFVAALGLARGLGLELLPRLGQSQFQVLLDLPPGTPLEQTDQRVRALQQALARQPGLENSFAVSGTGNRLDANPVQSGEQHGEIWVNADDSHATATLMARAREWAGRQPALQAEARMPTLFTLGPAIEVEIAGHDLKRLQALAAVVQKKLQALPMLVDVRSSVEQGYPEIRIRFDADRVHALGLQVRTLAERVVQQVQGKVASRYSQADRKIDIRVQGAEQARDSVRDLANMLVNPEAERPLPLSAVARIETGLGPAEIRRVDQERVAQVLAEVGAGDLGTAVAAVRTALRDWPLPPGFSLRVTGQNESMQASFQSLYFALGLAVFLVYLVMASQFESLLQPFVILFSVPLALIGAVLALWLSGATISVVVLIGGIMLAGIVVNNAIVLVDLINQLRRQGEPLLRAIEQAGRQRLRPILMTTLTTVLGLLPLALGLGEGAEIRAPMAVTVIGGLLLSTLLTLVVVPVIYSLVVPAQHPRSEAA